MSALRTPRSEGRAARLRGERNARCARATREAARQAPLGAVPAGGGLTLEQLLEGVWEDLRAGGAAACPMCEGELGVEAAPVGARCGGCGTVLS